MTRHELLNLLARRFEAKSYLEIGVQTGKTFNRVEVDDKVGVDPDPMSEATVLLKSDQFFKRNKKTFDLVFVDGLHQADAAYLDTINSLNCLNEGGIIVLDDCFPTQESWTTKEPTDYHWTGDVWKAWIRLCAELGEYNGTHRLFLLDEEFGLGVIVPKEMAQNRAGSNLKALPPSLSWEWWESERESLLTPLEEMRRVLSISP